MPTTPPWACTTGSCTFTRGTPPCLHGGHELSCLLHHSLQAVQHLALGKEIQGATKGLRAPSVSAVASRP